jgi:peptidoglycan/xylan/chitin deacetylase (PgdA/CDA1 family)
MYDIQVTVGLIGREFGESNDFVQFMLEVNRDPNWEVELAANGYNYTSWANMTFEEQVQQMRDFNNKLQSLYRIQARTIIPPFGTQNLYTTEAARAAGFTHVSNVRQEEPGPYALISKHLIS